MQMHIIPMRRCTLCMHRGAKVPCPQPAACQHPALLQAAACAVLPLLRNPKLKLLHCSQGLCCHVLMTTTLHGWPLQGPSHLCDRGFPPQLHASQVWPHSLKQMMLSGAQPLSIPAAQGLETRVRMVAAGRVYLSPGRHQVCHHATQGGPC